MLFGRFPAIKGEWVASISTNSIILSRFVFSTNENPDYSQCQYCNLAFCSSHHVTTFSPLASPSRPGHVCPQSPPPHALDRTTPLCPFCSLPVSIPLRPDGTQEDPNGPMERHIANACKGVDGKKEEMKRRRENGEICWRRGCGKGLVVKIRCDVRPSAV